MMHEIADGLWVVLALVWVVADVLMMRWYRRELAEADRRLIVMEMVTAALGTGRTKDAAALLALERERIGRMVRSRNGTSEKR